MTPTSDSRSDTIFKTVFSLSGLALIYVFNFFIIQRFGSTFTTNAVFGLGFLLLAGLALGGLAAIVSLPSLTGFLLAGFISGPAVLGVLDHASVSNLKLLNSFALALISMQAGAELTREMLGRNLKLLATSSFFHILIICGGCILVLCLFPGFFGLPRDKGFLTLLSLALLIGIVAASKSPAATIAILSESKAKNDLANYALGMVVLLDIFILILFSAAVAFAQGLAQQSGGGAFNDLSLMVEELIASVAAGSFFGVAMALYFRWINKERLLFILVLSYGVTALCEYLHYDTLLVFVVAGFFITNFTKQTPKLLETVESWSSVVLIVFFATAGASLHLDTVLLIWPAVVAFFLLRIALTYAADRTATKVVKASPMIQKWGFTPFISQAGLSIGLSVIISDKIPIYGPDIATLAIAVVTLNELFGPIIFKWALNRSLRTPA